jgi:hypothetical protein
VPRAQLSAGVVLAVSGPTTDQQPAFSWTPEFAGDAHRGQPYTFDFDWHAFALRDV